MKYRAQGHPPVLGAELPRTNVSFTTLSTAVQINAIAEQLNSIDSLISAND